MNFICGIYLKIYIDVIYDIKDDKIELLKDFRWVIFQIPSKWSSFVPIMTLVCGVEA